VKATLSTKLGDASGKKIEPIETAIEALDDQIWIKPKGYGDFSSADGYGAPICIERSDGRLRAILWPDINAEEPVIVDMEGARESMRKEEKGMEDFREIFFRGRKALVSELARPERLPDGWCFYGIRHADDDWDEPMTLERVVVCNRWGVIAFEKPLEESMFDGDGCVNLTDEERESLLDR